MDQAMAELLARKIEDLELSVRTHNVVKNYNVVTIGDLVRMTEAEVLRTPGLGRKFLTEVREVLARHGLHLGMKAP